MAKCELCKLKSAKHTLNNARHLTGKKVCVGCYQTYNEDQRQAYMFDSFEEDILVYDFDKPLDYEEFKDLLCTKLGYKNVAAFYKEIEMNPRSAVQTWKKKKKIPFLVRAYLQNKIDEIN